MYSGLLIVNGTIPLNQFWPSGESDGDTVKVKLSGQDAFQFSPTGDRAELRTTHVFEHATVKGSAKKSPIDKQNRVTIRLQGIDATELHYQPAPIPKGTSVTPEVKAAFKALN